MATHPDRVPEPIRFAEFELDLSSYELRRDGRPLKLERIPMELLLLLIERRGQLVSRNEIVESIWGHGVALDTDNSINGAIRKLRQVLKDDPDAPRFILTVTGKGYRFIGELDAPAPPPSLPLKPVTERPIAARRPRWVGPVLAATLLAVCAVFAWSHWRSRGDAPVSRAMIAVLPFQNLTGDASQDYISDGFTEETIARLGSLDAKRLGVIARTSVQRYKARPQALDVIGRDLGVQYVLEGSVRRTGDKLRITAQLIEIRLQTRVWSREYDGYAGDLLSLQDAIAQDVVRAIDSALPGAHPPAAVAVATPPHWGEAHDLYLKGRFFWNQRTPQAFGQAAELFEAAIAKAPDYAPAYAGLADTYALMGAYTSVPSSELLPKARAAAERAVALDDKLAEAHTSLAVIAQNYDWDYATAEREYRRALELNPNYATAHHWYGELLGFLGRFDEALAEFDRARELDPLSLIIPTDRAAVLLFARQPGRAEQEFRRVLAIDPDFPRASMVVYAYLRQGRYNEAIAQAEARRTMNDALWDWALLTYAYGRAGRTQKARAALAEFEARSGRQPIDPAPTVVAYLGVGNKERALSALERAVALHSSSVNALKVDPLYDDLRSDPRFTDLLRRVHLAQ